MSLQIQDGAGSGFLARVNGEKRLLTAARTHSIQNEASVQHGRAYQVLGETTLAAATKTVLYLQNDHTTLEMWITYIRIHLAGATGGSFGSATYFDMVKSTTYTSGGTATVPVNMNFTSGSAAVATAYADNPTLGGTAVQFEKWHPASAGDKNTFNKEGAIVLGASDSLAIRMTTDHTGGLALARISFIYGNPDDV